jgi:thiol-disulfide isomerase/thioredoxin
MTVEDPETSTKAPGEPAAKVIASTGDNDQGGQGKAAARSRGIVIDPRVLLVGGAVAVIGVAVLAVFLWMVPTAAAREFKAACRGLKVEPRLVPALCPDGQPCTLPVPAPDFTAKDVTGKDVKLSDYRGKVVLLNFWASWCNVCKSEKPKLNTMAAEMASDDFVVIAMASDHSWADPLTSVLESLAPQSVPQGKPTMEKVSAAFREALPNGTPFKVLLDPPDGDNNIGKITASWGITALPESALIDRSGNIRAYFVNKRDWTTQVAQTCLRSVIDGD